MTQITTPIVGAHFRPPAKQVLSVLPVGTPLILTPEPDNPYDSGAIRVSFAMTQYPISRWGLLTEALSGTGHDPHALMASEKTEGPLQLGYIPKSGAKTCLGGPGNVEVATAIVASDARGHAFEARLSLALEGYPTVTITTDLEG